MKNYKKILIKNIIDYGKNKNLHKIIRGNLILNSKSVRKTMETTENQHHFHHASQNWGIFAANKFNKQKYLKVTKKIRSLKFFTILHVKVEILYVNIKYANIPMSNMQTSISSKKCNYFQHLPEQPCHIWKTDISL